MSEPVVTVAIASYDAAAFLRDAVESALAQTLEAVEVIVVDDGSRDDSVAIARAMADVDPRVRVFATPRNLGPGGARNIALAEARGRWFAILDSDDLMTPDRLARLVAIGEADGADIVADDLIVFDHDGSAPPTAFLNDGQRTAPTSAWIDLGDYLERTVIYGKTADLGFLKPIIRTDRLRAAGLRYDEALRIAEDDDLVVRMLSAGLRYRIVGSAGYLYRRHGSSISHRLSAENAAAMLHASASRLAAATNHDARVRRAFATRHRAMTAADAFARWVAAMKARRIAAALAIPIARPAMLPLLRMPLGAAWRRLTRRARPVSPTVARAPDDAVADACALAAAHSARKAHDA